MDFLLEEETHPGSTRARLLTEASHLVSAASSLKVCTWARLWVRPRPLTHATTPPPLSPPHPLFGGQVQSRECGAGVDGGGLAARQKADAQQLSQRCSKIPLTSRRKREHDFIAATQSHESGFPAEGAQHRLEPCLVLFCFVFCFLQQRQQHRHGPTAAPLLADDADFKDQSHFSWRIFKGSLWSLLLDKHVVFTLTSFSPDVLSLGSNFSTKLNKTQTFFPAL